MLVLYPFSPWVFSQYNRISFLILWEKYVLEKRERWTWLINIICYAILWILCESFLWESYFYLFSGESCLYTAVSYLFVKVCVRERNSFFSGFQFLSFEGAFSLILLLTMTRREMIYDHLNRNSKNITNLFLFCGAFTFFFWNGFVVQRYFHSSLNYIVRNW